LCKEMSAGIGSGQDLLKVEHTEAHTASARIETAVAKGRVFADIDDTTRVLGIVDHGYEDDPRADFERAQYVVTFAIGKADQGKYASGFGGQTQGFGSFKTDGSVLALDPDGFEADLGGEGDEERRGAVDGDAADTAGLAG